MISRLRLTRAESRLRRLGLRGLAVASDAFLAVSTLRVDRAAGSESRMNAAVPSPLNTVHRRQRGEDEKSEAPASVGQQSEAKRAGTHNSAGFMAVNASVHEQHSRTIRRRKGEVKSKHGAKSSNSERNRLLNATTASQSATTSMSASSGQHARAISARSIQAGLCGEERFSNFPGSNRSMHAQFPRREQA